MLCQIADSAIAELAQSIDDAATSALADELAFFPKPGLVSFVDTGAHSDMDASTFLASIDSLKGYFADQARLGAAAAPFELLRGRGVRAEAVMTAATGGINTHRGAIFTLGILAAAAGYLIARGSEPLMGRLSLTVRSLWGDGIEGNAGLDPSSHGQRAIRRYKQPGAREEAAAGFPVLALQVWPQFAKSGPDSWLDALFTSMSVLQDTNILHRTGEAGQRWVQQAALDFLSAGGASASSAMVRALELHRSFQSRRISPGGSADMLAAACFVGRLQRIGTGR
jgi:triphosphoribosyl-dephospho-CoA synthase